MFLFPDPRRSSETRWEGPPSPGSTGEVDTRKVLTLDVSNVYTPFLPQNP